MNNNILCIDLNKTQDGIQSTLPTNEPVMEVRDIVGLHGRATQISISDPDSRKL